MLRILHRDELTLVVDKPAGVIAVPGRGDASVPLSAMVREIAPSALTVHRLDRDTSGCVIFALTREAHRALSLVFEGRKAEKVYLALCRGDLAAPQRIDAPLADARRGGMRLGTKGELRAQESLTEVTPEDRFGRFTLVRCLPRTGRTHQVRLHLASIGLPLLLDPRYGDDRPVQARELLPGAPDETVLTRTPLHAASLRLPHPSGKGWLQVESPLPPDMSRCLDLLRAARRA
jgi:RluA family pseudouridine synthase